MVVSVFPDPELHRYMSFSLNSFCGGYIGDCIGDYYRVIKGDTRSLDYSSYDHVQAEVLPRTAGCGWIEYCIAHIKDAFHSGV